MKWISVKDELPKEEGIFAVIKLYIGMQPRNMYSVEKGRPYEIKRGEQTYKNFGWSGENSDVKVTHWIKLPDPELIKEK